MFAWKIAPALATGNTVVIKTAEQTPLTALKLCELIKEAGFPAGVVNVIPGFGPVAGAAIASHMDIHKVAFTGSTLVGRQIMQVAAKTNLKKVTLELGDKSPNVIYDDADLEQAVKWCAFGFAFNAGQCCCAGTRVYVQEVIHEKFMARLKEVVSEMHVSGPWDGKAFHGPLVSQLQFDRVTGKSRRVSRKAPKSRSAASDTVPRATSSNLRSSPTSRRPTPSPRLKSSDLCVSPFSTLADLIDKANDSYYGLAAAVFTRDISRALETANRLQAGTVWINTYNGLDAQDPFGGYKQSGIGRELGEYALANYTNVKAVHVNPEVDSPTRQQENANSYDYDHHRDRDTESLMAHRPRLRSCSFDSLVPSLLCDSGPNTRILVQSTNRAEPVERLSSPSTKECLLDSEDAVPCNEFVQIVAAVSTTLRHKQGTLRPDKEVRKRNTRSL